MKRKIAVMVIHGIGEQEPFQTMNSFVSTFSKVYSSASGGIIEKKHLLRQFPDWIESYVSLNPLEDKKPVIDIFEYYWAYKTQRKVDAGEVVGWARTVSKGAKAYYKRQKELSFSGSNDILFKRDGEFKALRYVVNMLSFGNWIKYPFMLVCAKVPIVRDIVSFLLSTIGKRLGKSIVDSMGDVTLYTTTDRRSEYYNVRQDILDGSVEKVVSILNDDEYDEVVIIGHSLGSVIAYDTIARINKKMNIDSGLGRMSSKLKGLVTFGSPLDKIAFFFDEKINRENEPVRYTIVSQLNGFKRRNVDNITLDNGINQYFDHVRWLNFWTKPDPVCGHLDVYRDLENIELIFPEEKKGSFIAKAIRSKISIKAHSGYWGCSDMYERIADEFDWK